MPSIRQQIATYVEATLAAAVLQTSGSTLTAGKVLELEHKASILAECKQWPSLHFALGDESARETELDNRGITMVCPLDLKLTAANYLDLPADVEAIVAAVQDALEADRTFGGLLSEVAKYAGRQEFMDSATAPIGGTVLTYLLQYRRLHGAASTNY